MLRKLLDRKKWKYLLSGLTNRLTHRRRCPVCQGTIGVPVDRKFFHSLLECQGCGILYRYPSETQAQMDDYFQTDFDFPDLTTQLPPEPELSRLLETNFADTVKNASRVVALLAGLGLGPGARLLDYGASWGYQTYQFKKARFEVESFEISKPRAALGKKIGLHIESDIGRIGTGFDAVYSGHVLQHINDPLSVLRWMVSRCRPGGFVLAFTPNGSAEHRAGNFGQLHAHWGLMHPVLLT
ncbi:MAG: methyltransferase domain-containing protein, partial [Burkholderiales bacterium]|nr:methyltransferase domain-containing protein [Burkholderiales bacterium]